MVDTIVGRFERQTAFINELISAATSQDDQFYVELIVKGHVDTQKAAANDENKYHGTLEFLLPVYERGNNRRVKSYTVTGNFKDEEECDDYGHSRLEEFSRILAEQVPPIRSDKFGCRLTVYSSKKDLKDKIHEAKNAA
ncbi:hypothetical protein KY328_02045 [Candidatus Woesearchaeota archaeon]|nr:hypothetical protein [Candidatus Woesearchaeota archaeon]MBW3021675.1 hypothetical protein [Candidatus Woesearchaeota archaeon]